MIERHNVYQARCLAALMAVCPERDQRHAALTLRLHLAPLTWRNGEAATFDIGSACSAVCDLGRNLPWSPSGHTMVAGGTALAHTTAAVETVVGALRIARDSMTVALRAVI